MELGDNKCIGRQIIDQNEIFNFQSIINLNQYLSTYQNLHLSLTCALRDRDLNMNTFINSMHKAEHRIQELECAYSDIRKHAYNLEKALHEEKYRNYILQEENRTVFNNNRQLKIENENLQSEMKKNYSKLKKTKEDLVKSQEHVCLLSKLYN